MTTISDCFLAPVILRASIGLLLCSHSLTTQATQFEPLQMDIFSIQLTHNDTNQQISYLFNTKIVNTVTNNLAVRKTSPLPAFSEYKKGEFWITSIRWHFTTDSNQASLSPRFRLESKESRIEIRPLQRSIWMTWRRALP
jgi:hypothetical protein